MKHFSKYNKKIGMSMNKKCQRMFKYVRNFDFRKFSLFIAQTAAFTLKVLTWNTGILQYVFQHDTVLIHSDKYKIVFWKNMKIRKILVFFRFFPFQFFQIKSEVLIQSCKKRKKEQNYSLILKLVRNEKNFIWLLFFI